MSNSELFVGDAEIKVFEFGFLQSSPLNPNLRPKLGILLDGFQISAPANFHSEEGEEASPSFQKLEISKIGESQVEEEQEEEDGDGFRTPTSSEHKITEFQNCPPAPKKPKSATKRRASDVRYSHIDPGDLEFLFQPILAGREIKKLRTEKIQ